MRSAADPNDHPLGEALDHTISAALEPLVDCGEMAGAATLLFRDGAVQHQGNFGWSDVERASSRSLVTRCSALHQ
jgi:hypothetical protein